MKRNTKTKQSGQAMIIAAVFFLVISFILMLGLSSPVLRQIKNATDFNLSRGSLYAAESITDDLVVRFKTGKSIPASPSLTLNYSTSDAVISDVPEGKSIVATGNSLSVVRRTATTITAGSGVAFHYGVQVGDGGFDLQNTSSILGNVFSNGPITGAGNTIKGDVISAGISGLVDGIHATSSVWAHTITGSDIEGDAYYTTISGTSVDGVLYPGSPDQEAAELPITDDIVEDWKLAAASGGTLSSPCPYKITEDQNLGPIKIDCNLDISGDPTITLDGHVWVAGNIDIQNTAVININSSLGDTGLVVVADDLSDRVTGSKIILQNSVQFNGSGPGNKSYVLFISQNNDAEGGGNNIAIEAKNSVNGDLLLYAGHGLIELQNSISLKEVSAYRIRTKNTAEVIYETGLANLLFSAGPGGGYDLDFWKEVE
ncbi:MAG: hypothetical protein Q8P52_03220 [bacterium]|nr:hypothetical protein [bacterium]